MRNWYLRLLQIHRSYAIIISARYKMAVFARIIVFRFSLEGISMANRSSAVGRAQGEIQMTSGSLWKNMLVFSIPLMLSQLLQVLFNMADVAVVGKFSSAEALGAVG